MTGSVITSPLDLDTVRNLRVGDHVLIRGILYTARDAAHQRLVEALSRGDKLPFDIRGQTIYYCGPSPARPGRPVGSAGPTTSKRMDVFTPQLLDAGLRAMIGKGARSPLVKEYMIKHNAIYLIATGGAGALISQSIKRAEVVAYADLGAEAILRLEVEDFPAIVAYDLYGGDLYEMGRNKYRKQLPRF